MYTYLCIYVCIHIYHICYSFLFFHGICTYLCIYVCIHIYHICYSFLFFHGLYTFLYMYVCIHIYHICIYYYNGQFLGISNVFKSVHTHFNDNDEDGIDSFMDKIYKCIYISMYMYIYSYQYTYIHIYIYINTCLIQFERSSDILIASFHHIYENGCL
jgi:hypothetical protein